MYAYTTIHIIIDALKKLHVTTEQGRVDIG